MNTVITGTGQGIGFETAKILCEEKVQVIAVSRDRSKLETLKNQCDPAFLQCIPFDLTENNLHLLTAQIQERMPAVDLLINNAGMLINKPFADTEAEELEKLFKINFFAPYRLIRQLLPLMRNRQAHILNIGSMGGYQGSVKFPGLSAYSASKAALANLTESLAAELQDMQIKVNCLALGAVDTEMLAQAFPDYKAPVTAKEMGQFITRFALTGHHFFNGKIIPVSLSTP